MILDHYQNIFIALGTNLYNDIGDELRGHKTALNVQWQDNADQRQDVAISNR